MIKRIYLFLMGMMALTASAHAQNLTGKVIDEKNMPLVYANVILQTADSVYLAGTITDIDGKFVLEKYENAKLINISYIGYSTVVKKLTSNHLGDIQLYPDAQLLGEVVVKGYLPKTQAKGDAMVTTVAGTVLEKAGTAEHLLDKIPNVTDQNGEINVFGRGTPEIYINGRKVRSQQELDQLSSDNIKSVEVVSNPGARYDASVKAVIRIITKKVAGEGFGVDNRAVARNKRVYGWTVYDQLNLNYRKNGFDLSGMIFAGNFNNGNDQTFVIDTYLDKQWKQNLDLTDQKFRSKNLEATLSLNYQFNENHAIGVRYNWEKAFDDNSIINQFAQTYCDNKMYEDLHSNIEMKEPEGYHRTNFYYSGKVKDWSIDFNADGLWSDSESKQITKEEILGGLNEAGNRSVTTFDTKKNELYAGKLVVSHPVAKGNLSFGGEYSHNKRNTTYFNEEGIIANDQAMIKEAATSAFIEYARAFHKVQMQAGLRYEKVGFDYYDAGKYMTEQSKDYNNLFPSINFSFPLKNVQMQMGYACDIQRPTYHELRSNIIYVNRYMYDEGNPFLMPSITHNVTWASSYKWMNLYVGYSHIMDDITNQTVAYSEDDPTIALLTLRNSPAYDKLVAALNFSPTIGIWTPQLGLAIQKQWYEGETLQGKEKFNKPIGTVTFRNNLSLPKGFLLGINATWMSKGYDENIYVSKDMITMSASLYKSFLKDKLSVHLNANNLLEQKQEVTIFSGMRSMQNTQAYHRQFDLTLRYKFNSTKSKYKGTGAGDSQKSRM